MKTLYCKMVGTLLGFLMMFNYAKAHEVDTTYAARINYIFKFLDKSKIPTGILKDASLELAELNYYKGLSLQDSSIVVPENFRDIYITLATGQLGYLPSGILPNPNLVDSIWFAKRKPGQVTLAGLYYQYSRFADDAPNKVTIVNDQIYDQYLNGVWQNPYKVEQAMAFSPADLEYKGLTFTLLLPAQLWLSNNKQQVSKIEVNMDDGLGYRQLSPNTGLPVVYADSGLKVLKFKIWLSNNTILQSHSVLHISKTGYESTPLNPALISAADPGFIVSENAFSPEGEFLPQPAALMPVGWIPIQESAFKDEFIVFSTETYNGKKAEGVVTIAYVAADKKIRKPLIVVEGFDPGIYSKPENIYGENTFDGFIFSLQNSNSSELKNFVLYTPEYDIIYIDWKDGTADIRQNALLLKTVIKAINQVKVANGANPIEKNVVLGQSMGGVIARYALKKMEDAGENHDTRLYISHDAPHQGANVPLAYQAAILHLRTAFVKPPGDNPANFSVSAGPYLKQAYLGNTPASKQMLVNTLKYDNFLGTFSLDDAVHVAWQTELAALGYPQQCRNIAISNGSECGTPSVNNPGDHLIYFDGYYKTKFLTDILAALSADFLAPILGLATKSWKVFYYTLIPGSNKFSFHIEANSLAANGVSNLIYKNKLVYMKKVLWLIPVKETLVSKTAFAPPGLKTVENFPGGYFSFMEEELVKNDVSDNAFYKGSYELNIKNHFSFIPTTSALDIGKGQVVLSQADYYQPYVGATPPPAPKNTPFDNFITAFSGGIGANEEHISFTQRNGKWLADELNLQSTFSNCSYFCSLSSNAILGPSCFDINQSYNISLPVGSTIKWSVFGPAIISGANDQSTVSLSGNGMGTATLYATIQNEECGTKTVSKSINVGIVTPQIAYTFVMGNVPIWYTFKVTNPSPNLVYKWYVNDVLNFTSQPGENLFLYQGTCNTYYNVKCTASSDCLTSGYSNVLLPGKTCLSAHHFAPNPVDDELKVYYTEEMIQEFNRLNTSLPEFEIRLYNEKGLQVISQQSREGEPLITIDTRDLANGYYFLHIQQGDQITKKQIIIQH